MKNKYHLIKFDSSNHPETVKLISASEFELYSPLTGKHVRNGANSQILVVNDSYILKRFTHQSSETKKLEYLHQQYTGLATSSEKNIQCAWPTFLILDEINYEHRQRGHEYKYYGYIMPRIHNAKSLDEYFGQGSLCDRILIAYQLARSIERLHQQCMAIGDISSNNILVTHQDSQYTNVVLIDCDSFVVQTPTSELYRTLYHTDPYYCRRPSDAFTLHDFQTNDAFGFAVLCFQLLMGINPFDVIDNPFYHPQQQNVIFYGRKKYSDFLRIREFPLFSDNKYVYEGHQTTTLQQQFMKLPLRIQDAFNKSFTDKNYEVTSISTWVQHLETFVMRICNFHHLPNNDERLNQSFATADQISFPKSSG